MGVLFFESEIGIIRITEEENYISGISIVNTKSENIAAGELLAEARKQLEEYFKGERENFTFPIKLNGTEFQKAVWQELLKIPFGETRSYSDIAVSIGKEKALRAVGTAIGKNPLLIAVPCHRVINKNGGTGGFSCGIIIKKRLMEKENIII